MHLSFDLKEIQFLDMGQKVLDFMEDMHVIYIYIYYV